MHPDEMDIPDDLVVRLVAEQFPEWAGLPVRRVDSTGTVNAIFRLGPELAVRLSRVPWGAGNLAKDRDWRHRLAPHLPVAIPEVVAIGSPTPEYPLEWSIQRWLDGENPVPGAVRAPERLAGDLAEVIRAFRAIDLPEPPSAYRGGPLDKLDAKTRAALAQLTNGAAIATAIWDEAVRGPQWSGPPTWVHGDLMPGNLLIRDGRLSAVIDLPCAGVGDPACDLVVAWNLLPPSVRPAFRAAVGIDEATWRRGRARALSIAVVALPHYQDSNPVFAAEARHTIREVLNEYAKGSTGRDPTRQ